VVVATGAAEIAVGVATATKSRSNRLNLTQSRRVRREKDEQSSLFSSAALSA
jgi:hypothetical protein